MTATSKKILLISDHMPTRRHAGGLRLLDVYAELRRLQPNLYLALLTVKSSADQLSLLQCEALFNEVHCLSSEEFSGERMAQIDFRVDAFDLVDLQYHTSGRMINKCRKRWPLAVLLFGPMESQIRALLIWFSSGAINILRDLRTTLVLLRNALFEVVYVFRADRVVCVSEADRYVVAHFKPRGNLFCLPTCLSPLEFHASDIKVSHKNGVVVVYFAYFGSATNREALAWYCREVHPLVERAVPQYRLRVVGRGLSGEDKLGFLRDNIDFVGEVEHVQDGLRDSTVGIAPALSGAGIRGKIHQYVAFGIPCVASSIACESLLYKHDVSILMASNAKDFAMSCIELLKDKKRRDRISASASRVLSANYTWASWEDETRAIYGLKA